MPPAGGVPGAPPARPRPARRAGRVLVPLARSSAPRRAGPAATAWNKARRRPLLEVDIKTLNKKIGFQAGAAE